MSTSEAPNGTEDVRRLAWRVWALTAAANGVGGVAVGFTIWLYTNLFTGGLPAGRRLRAIVVIGVADFGVLLTLALPIAFMICTRSAGWLSQSRAPTNEDLTRLARIPRLIVLTSLVLWIVGTGVAFALFLRVARYHIEAGSRQVIATCAAFAYGALLGLVLSHLLIERQLRPFFSTVLTSRPEWWAPSIGVGGRLVLAWFAVAGAPLLLLGYYSFGVSTLPPSASHRQDVLDQIALALTSSCALAFVMGLAVFIYAGRAITAPLGRVQDGLRRVARGDLSSRVDVYEVGEIGRLESGFNEMVQGLQEREKLRELFGRHVGAEVAARAIRGANLGGARCEASALFVDIIASTRLAESEDATDVVAILNDFFEAVVRVVGSEGGFVNKFHGDGALCVFGAPIEQTDHADRALRAARVLAAELTRLDGIEMAIGLSSGNVVAGNVGASDRYEFTVIGDAVNEASRLCDEAKKRPSHVLATGSAVTRAEAEQAFWVRTDKVQLRGRSAETEIFEPSRIV